MEGDIVPSPDPAVLLKMLDSHYRSTGPWCFLCGHAWPCPDNQAAALIRRLSSVHVILKEGVYRHECCGVFSTLELADAAEKQLLAEESDTYHNFLLIPFEVDREIERDEHGTLQEPKDERKW